MSRVIVVEPGGGESISGGSSARHVKVDIDDLHVTEYTVEDAPMGDLHTHERHSDAFYVLEGELEVAISETETVRLGPGGFAAYLREIVALRERGEEPTRDLFERFDMHILR